MNFTWHTTFLVWSCLHTWKEFELKQLQTDWNELHNVHARRLKILGKVCCKISPLFLWIKINFELHVSCSQLMKLRRFPTLKMNQGEVETALIIYYCDPSIYKWSLRHVRLFQYFCEYILSTCSQYSGRTLRSLIWRSARDSFLFQFFDMPCQIKT